MTDFGAIYDAVNGGEDHLTDEGRAAAAEARPYKPCWDIHEGVPIPPGRIGAENEDGNER